MLRRATDYFTGRASIAIVNEARGLPYQIVNLLFAFPWVMNGLRCLLDCHYIFPYEDNTVADSLEAAFPDCVNNPWTALAAAYEGHFSIFLAVVRIYMATTGHVANFYSAMTFVVLVDASIIFIMFRMKGGWDQTHRYDVFVITCLMYELYVMLGARRAYQKRTKQAKQAGLFVYHPAPMKEISLALAVVYVSLSVRALFFCDTTIPVLEGDAMKDIIQGMYPDCRTEKWQEFSSGFVGLVFFNLSALELNTLLATDLAKLYHASILTVFSAAVHLAISVRAGFTELPLFHQVLLVGALVWDSFILKECFEANQNSIKAKAD